MPSIGANGETILAINRGVYTMYDGGLTYPVQLDFPVTATALQIQTVIDEIGQGSNAATIRRGVHVNETVTIGDPQLEIFDEKFAGVNTIAKMKWFEVANPQNTFVVEVPAPDASMLTADYKQVIVSAGQGQTIKTAVEAALGAGWGYAGSWVAPYANRAIPATSTYTLTEPSGLQLPGDNPAT